MKRNKIIKKSLPAGRQGFTLIEIMVAIFIIAMVSSIMVVNWRKNEEKYKLQRAAQEMVQNVRKAQNMALAGKEYNGEMPNASYGVHFEKNQKTSYFIFADGNGNETYQPSDDAIVDGTITIESGIEIYSLSSDPQDLNIAFSIPDGFVDLKPSGASATITLRRVNQACPQNCKNVIITKTGQITIQ